MNVPNTSSFNARRTGARMAAALLVAAPMAMSGSAAEARDLVMHTKSVPANGGHVATMVLERGKRYRVEISGSTHFGTWPATKRALKNDACYEFNSGRGYVPLPVVKSSHNLNFCASGYRASHSYSSPVFYGDGRMLSLWVYDTDYRDNYGSYYAKVILVK